jgi:hypothetical protein
MGALNVRRTKTRLPFKCKAHYRTEPSKFRLIQKNVDSEGAIIRVEQHYSTFPRFYTWQPNANCLTF